MEESERLVSTRVFNAHVPSAANLREHWRVRAKRTSDQRLSGFCFGAVCKEPLPVVVTLTRIASRPLDSDNLQSAFKAFRDGIADAHGVDDKDESVIKWVYAQRKGKPREVAVEVSIERVEGKK